MPFLRKTRGSKGSRSWVNHGSDSHHFWLGVLLHCLPPPLTPVTTFSSFQGPTQINASSIKEPDHITSLELSFSLLRLRALCLLYHFALYHTPWGYRPSYLPLNNTPYNHPFSSSYITQDFNCWGFFGGGGTNSHLLNEINLCFLYRPNPIQ